MPRITWNSTMKQVLYEITEMNFASKKNMPVLSDHLKKLCRLIVNQRKHFDPVKREMNEKDWHLSHSAKKLIDENLTRSIQQKKSALK